jgi:hypothetical protein
MKMTTAAGSHHEKKTRSASVNQAAAAGIISQKRDAMFGLIKDEADRGIQAEVAGAECEDGDSRGQYQKVQFVPPDQTGLPLDLEEDDDELNREEEGDDLDKKAEDKEKAAEHLKEHDERRPENAGLKAHAGETFRGLLETFKLGIAVDH